MKNVNLIVVFMAFSTMAIAGEGSESENKSHSMPVYSISGAESSVYWEGAKPGGTHKGVIDVIKGSASTDGEEIAGGSFEIDMNSIRNEDIESEGGKDRLVKHLKSDDFFYVEKYPTASFVIKRAEVRSGKEQMITGDLTIRGNTHEISFPAEISLDAQMIHAKTGEIKLDRTLWEVNHQSKSVFAELKDNFIEDEMIIRLDLHFSRD